MTKNVEHVCFKDEINHKVMLRELADDDDLAGVMVVCVWEDGIVSVGHSTMRAGLLAMGALMLQEAALESARD